MQQDGHDSCIGCVSMQAAHDTAQIPLLLGQILDGLESAGYAGAKKYQQPYTADQDNPAGKNGQGAQVIERAGLVRKTTGEQSSQD